MGFIMGSGQWVRDRGVPVGQQVQMCIGCCMLRTRLTKRAVAPRSLEIGAGVVGTGEARCTDRAGCSALCEYEYAKR